MQRTFEAGSELRRRYALGRTKVFLRQEARDALEDAREEALSHVIKAAQACARKWLAGFRYRRYKKAIAALETAVDASDLAGVDQALADWHLPPGSLRLPV